MIDSKDLESATSAYAEKLKKIQELLSADIENGREELKSKGYISLSLETHKLILAADGYTRYNIQHWLSGYHWYMAHISDNMLNLALFAIQTP